MGLMLAFECDASMRIANWQKCWCTKNALKSWKRICWRFWPRKDQHEAGQTFNDEAIYGRRRARDWLGICCFAIAVMEWCVWMWTSTRLFRQERNDKCWILQEKELEEQRKQLLAEAKQRKKKCNKKSKLPAVNISNNGPVAPELLQNDFIPHGNK